MHPYFFCISIVLIAALQIRFTSSLSLERDSRGGPPENWRDLLAPDVYQRYKEKNTSLGLGRGLFEGDVHPPPPPEKGNRQDSARSGDVKWFNGVVPIKMSDRYSVEEKHLIMAAMDEINMATGDCIRFINATTQQSYLNVAPVDNSCWSYIGRLSPPQSQQLNLAPDCLLERGVVIHELLHALGFWHEQSRSDRDENVIIYKANVESHNSFVSNFEKKLDSNNLGLPYDFESIMHYPWNAFARDQTLPTILPLRKTGQYEMGQRKRLTNLDVQKIRRFYDCEAPDERTTTVRATRRTVATIKPTTTTTEEACVPFVNC